MTVTTEPMVEGADIEETEMEKLKKKRVHSSEKNK